MRGLTSLVTLLALWACAPPARASQFDPHVPEPAQRSWFEGWYMRLTSSADASDAAAPASLALTVGAMPRALVDWNSSLISLLVQNSRWVCP